MPEPVLSHARAVLPRMQADFQELLAELYRHIEENRRHSAEMEEATRALAARQAELERHAFRREQERQREWEKKSENIIADFEARAQLTLERLLEAGEQRKAAEQAQRQIAKTRREFKEEAAEALAPPPEIRPPSVPPQAPIEEGAHVRLKDIREIVTVARLLKNGLLEVQAGFLKMQVPREEIIEVLSPTAGKRDVPSNVRFEPGPRWDLSYRELNVIGQRAEEAIENVDKFLDSAALASVNRVRIIHGHGKGVLKKAVGEHLSANPHVSRFYPAAQSEGGAGATIVELRE
jgi:DNA mismatch repair protein MutS2